MSFYTTPTHPDLTSPASSTQGSSSASSTPSSSVLPVMPIDENVALYTPTPPPKDHISSVPLPQPPSTSSFVRNRYQAEPSHRRTRSAREIIQQFEVMDAKFPPPKGTSQPQRPRLNSRPAYASSLTATRMEYNNNASMVTYGRPKPWAAVNRNEKASTTDKPYRLPRLLSPLSRARARAQTSQIAPIGSAKPSTPPAADHLKTSLPSTTSHDSIKVVPIKPSTSPSSGGISGVKSSFQTLLNVFGGGKRKKKIKQAEESSEGEIGFAVDRSGKAIAIHPSSANSGGVKTGYLAHLTPNKTSWTQCIAVLDPPYLTLTPISSSSSSTNELSSSISVTRLFDLSNCSNTRSISDVKLGPDIPKPIVPTYVGGEGDKDSAYVFEIELDGGAQEFFASATLKERGGWVSAIWDIILSSPSHDYCLDTIAPGPSSPHVDANTETGTPTMFDGDLRLQPPLRVVNGTASHLSCNSSAYEGSLGEDRERIVSPQDHSVSSSGRGTMAGLSAVGSDNASASGRSHDREELMTTTMTSDLSTTTSASDPDEEFPYPLPKHLGRNKVNAHTVRARPGIELSDGDDPTESWRPFNNRKNISSSHSLSSASHDTRYDGLLPSTSLNPFARRRMSKNEKTASAAGNALPTALFALGTSASETTETLTPSTLATRVSQISPDYFSETHQTSPPTPPSKDQDLPSIHRVMEQKVVPSESQNESRQNHQDSDSASSSQLHGQLKTVVAMLDELLQRSASSALATASANDSFETKLNQIALLLDSVVSRVKNIDSTTFLNLPPRRRATSEVDLSAETIMERLDSIRRKFPDRSERATPQDHSSEEMSKMLNVILEHLDDLKRHKRFLPSAEGEKFTSELARIHAKLDSLAESYQRAATKSAPEENDVPPASDPNSVLSEPQPSVPLQRSLSVFDARSRRRSTMPTAPSVEIDSVQPDTRHHEMDEQLSQILEILKEERETRTNLKENQDSSLKYLHDLNEWLERFVARHATQMQDVTTGVAKLSRSMGIHVATSDAPTGGDGPATHASLHAPMHEILSEVQRGIVALQQRANNEDDVNRALLTLVHNAGVHVDRLANERQSMTPEVFMDLLQRQRYDHAQLVQTLAADLAEEIRGERIRFVDAMKEATTVNLQKQIHEFKEQLTKEVVGMEHELTELFAYRYIMKAKGNINASE